MGNVENAIAAALKKEGIEPPLPKLQQSQSKFITAIPDGKQKQQQMQQHLPSSNKFDELPSRKSKKRKRREQEKELRKVTNK